MKTALTLAFALFAASAMAQSADEIVKNNGYRVGDPSELIAK